MDPALINALLDGGTAAILIYLVMDMRKEAREDRAQLWQLIGQLLRRDDPDIEVPPLPSQQK